MLSNPSGNEPLDQEGRSKSMRAGHERSSRLLSNTLWEIGARWGQFVGVAAINIWAARHLGPEIFGLLAYALSVVAVLKLVSLLGAELHLKAEFVRSVPVAESTLASALWLRLLGSVTIYLMLLAYVFMGDVDRDAAVLLLVAGSMVFCSISDVLQSYYASVLQARKVAIASLSGTALSIGVRVAAITMESPLWVFGMANALEFIFAGILLALRFRVERPLRLEWRPDWGRIKEILVRSFPLYVSAIAISIYLRADQLMIQWLAGSEALGWYAAAARLADRLHLIPVALGATFLPVILDQKARRSAAIYHANMQRYFDLSVLISLGLILGYYAAGQFVVGWMLGAAYTPTVEILGVLVLCVPFMALGIARGQYVVAEGWYRLAMVTNVSGAIINILLNLLWIPIWGAVGAAWATLVSFFFIHVVASFIFPPTRDWGRRQVWALLLPLRPRTIIAIVYELAGVVRQRMSRGK